MTKGSKGPKKVAEEEPEAGIPPVVVAKRVLTDTPPPDVPTHIDNRNTFSVFVVHKEEVGPAVGQKTGVFTAFLALDERFDGGESGGVTALLEELGQGLQVSLCSENAFREFLEGCGFGEREHTKLTLGLVGLVLGKIPVQVVVAIVVSRGVGKAVSGGFGLRCTNCDGFEEGEDLLDLRLTICDFFHLFKP